VAGLCYAAALSMVHLSRLAEELVLWTSAEYGFAELDDRAATGSSMMPQKKNPDAAELTRGKAGTAIGRLAGLLATLKGLPLAYNRDLQEDKQAAFGQMDDLLGALAAMRVCVEGLRVDRARMLQAAADGATVATDVAEQLVRAGMPFRQAHAEVAGRVAAGERFVSPTAREAAEARLSLEGLGEQLRRAREAVQEL
jgi:argininosuccinate lyase